MAQLSEKKFDELSMKYPALMEDLKSNIYNYEDNLKLFKEKCLMSIEYLKGIPKPIIHEIMYKMVSKTFEKGYPLYGVNDIADSMYII